MSSGLKWCEWCYSSHEMSVSECSNCDSSSFLHQDPRKPKLLREDAIKKRGNQQYDPRPRTVISDISEATLSFRNQLQDGNPNSPGSYGHAGSYITKTSFTPEEQKLNAEIAEIVTQIEILDRKLQQLLSKRSPEIRKLNEERDKAVTTKAVRSAAITSAAATGLSDVLGDIFGD